MFASVFLFSLSCQSVRLLANCSLLVRSLPHFGTFIVLFLCRGTKLTHVALQAQTEFVAAVPHGVTVQ